MAHSDPEVYEGQGFVDFRQAVMESAEYAKAATGYFKNPNELTGADLDAWMGSDNGNPTEIWLNRLRLTDTEIKNYMAGKTVDWKDLTLHTAFRQDYTVSVSGKKEDMSYYSSINYLKNESNNIGGDYTAIRARVNLENKVQKFLTYGVNAQFTHRDEAHLGLSRSWSTALSPFGDVYDENGNLTLYPNDNLNATNPLLTTEYTDRRYDFSNLNTSLYLKLELPLGFSLQTIYSPRFEWMNFLYHRSADHLIEHALDEYWGFKFDGVCPEDESEETAKYAQRPGDPKILDVDKNYKYNNDDKVFQGNLTPKVRWNMVNNFTLFKNFDISLSMYSYLGHIKSQGRFTNNDALLNTTNQIKRDYWTPQNKINDYPRLSAKSPAGVGYTAFSSMLRLCV